MVMQVLGMVKDQIVQNKTESLFVFLCKRGRHLSGQKRAIPCAC